MGINWYLAHLMVSSNVCDALIPELVQTKHVIDKLLSGQSTVLTRKGGGEQGVALRIWVGKDVRPKSKWKGTFFGAGWVTQITQLRYQNRQKCEKGYIFQKNLEYNGAKRGVFHCMSLKNGYTPLPVYDDARFSDLFHPFRINKLVQV